MKKNREENNKKQKRTHSVALVKTNQHIPTHFFHLKYSPSTV